MSDPSAELGVTWLHDRLYVVLPVDRDRALPLLALGSCVAILAISLSGGLLPGLVLGILPLFFRDRRQAAITIDHRQVVFERWFLGRPTEVRIPLRALDLSIGTAADRLCLVGPDAAVTLRWGGSRESLQWLADQIVRAKSAAPPVEEAPTPPAELSLLRRESFARSREGTRVE